MPPYCSAGIHSLSNFETDDRADLVSGLCCFDTDGSRRPSGRLLRPSGTRVFVHGSLLLRAVAQRPTIVEAARRRIAVPHRPGLR